MSPVCTCSSIPSQGTVSAQSLQTEPTWLPSTPIENQDLMHIYDSPSGDG